MLLGAGARVAEIGSHYGAFLQTAKDWCWRAEGVDIGKDTSRFARWKGFRVHTREIRDCGFDSGSFDGVFIWNCFDQIADPIGPWIQRWFRR
ncbi:MAG: class I SAM-dependent methyltransferase [Bryobacteraceae bacterium]